MFTIDHDRNAPPGQSILLASSRYLRPPICPHLPWFFRSIRLDVTEFTPSRSQRKVIYRFNRYVNIDGLGDEKDGVEVIGSSDSTSKGKKGKKVPPPKAKKDGEFSLIDELHSTEAPTRSPDLKFTHEYDVTLEPSSFTQEKFELYCRYQVAIHNDHDKAPSSFSRFLCDTPLRNQRILYSKPPPSYLPVEYGSYHQMYRLDGELIAMGVVDVLPHCVSSVYLVYSPKMEEHSLGKLSALKEIALAQEMARYGAPGMGYLYMGFYIHSCSKMKYKAQYSPSFLLEPTKYTWHRFETCAPLLDKFHYVPFARPTRARRPITPESGSGRAKATEVEDTNTQEDGIDVGLISQSVLESVAIGNVRQGTVYTTPAQKTRLWKDPSSKELIRETSTALGEELAASMILIM
ncbi:Arginyl-tRNA--protein transferase 1 [Tulasnella sp. JGI-2019a]|nr:Arginyl-tRNA--protein transferase 1 [Tulasnella sp. JGI-2019a]